MPKHFQNRNDMIKWLIAQCPRPAIVRALDAGRVEFLGGFKPLLAGMPGWCFRVTLAPKNIKNVCILCNDKKYKYEIRIVKHVPWQYWNGVMLGKLIIRSDLNRGDNPTLYLNLWRLKNAETR